MHCVKIWLVEVLTEEDVAKLIAVMKSYERKSKLPHYNMWGKATGSYKFKVEEFRLVAEECPKSRGSDVLALDAGCGVGVYASMLSQRGYGVVALDVSAGMLKKAKNSVEDGNVSFVRGSITHLPFRQSEFDLILCVDTLHHFTHAFYNEAIREFRCVIKVGGIFITDIRSSLNPLLLVRYRIANSKWNQIGGLALEARRLRDVKKVLRRHGFRFGKSLGIGFALHTFAPYVLIVSKASKPETQ